MNQENNIRIGKQLMRIRDHLGMEQKAFAESLGITQGNISNIETGKRRITADVLTALASKFKVNINCFFYEDEPQLFISKEKDQIKQILNTLSKIKRVVENTGL